MQLDHHRRADRSSDENGMHSVLGPGGCRPVSAAVNAVSSDLLHKRRGHVKDVEGVARNHARDLTGDLRVCALCAKGKSARQAVLKQAKKSTKRLELVHQDLAGPVSDSFGGSRYATVCRQSDAFQTCIYYQAEVRCHLCAQAL